MGVDVCVACDEHPIVRCGRCSVTRCRTHAFAPGERCERCERDYDDEAPTRRNAKILFAPPVALLSGGLLFGLLLPITLGGALGAAIMCSIACATGVGAGVGACSLVDRSARAVFLRERNGLLPPARLVRG
jgi:hypothetical protein